MITRQMLKEEWRLHSELFSGRSFAFFPLIILSISAFGFWTVDSFSTLSAGALSEALIFLGGFMGLAVGSIGFSSSDAMKNVLGPTNFLVYSSRTLPVSRKRLLAAFIVKDIVYYSLLFLAPIALGAVLAAGKATLTGSLLMFGGFLAGLVFSVSLAQASMKLPGLRIGYRKDLSPLVSKSILDVSRSAGGFLKIIFSLSILTGFYWFMVLYFPFTDSFLSNPVLSFSVLIGTVSLTVYNWINRFDSFRDYSYLPLSEGSLLTAKQKGFLLISLPLTFTLLLISAVIYPAAPLDLGLALIASFSTQVFTVGLASYLTGLEPNSRLFDSIVFTRFLILNSIFVMPLLAFSVFYVAEYWHYFLFLSAIPGVAGVYLGRKASS